MFLVLLRVYEVVAWQRAELQMRSLVTTLSADFKVLALSKHATILSHVSVTKDGVRIGNWIY
jgi:hypothetical protein